MDRLRLSDGTAAGWTDEGYSPQRDYHKAPGSNQKSLGRRQKKTTSREREAGLKPSSSTVTESRSVRWVGCVFRTELRRAGQTRGVHQNGTNTKPRKVTTRSRQEVGKKKRLHEKEAGFLSSSYTVTESGGVRWIGCVFRTELQQAGQTKGIHQSRANNKAPESNQKSARSRQKEANFPASRERRRRAAIDYDSCASERAC